MQSHMIVPRPSSATDGHVSATITRAIKSTALTSAPILSKAVGNVSTGGDPREALVKIAVHAALSALLSQPGFDAVGMPKGETVVEIGPQSTVDFSTWSWWGTTHCKLENLGVATDIGITVGAGHEDVFLTPAGTSGYIADIARQWAGFRLYVTNTSKDPGSLVRVTVW